MTQKPETSSGRGDAGAQQERHPQAATGMLTVHVGVCREAW